MKVPLTYEIEVAIANYFNYRVNIIVPNISWGMFIHECDVFIATPAGYVTEVEIKRSYQDLNNDFKKRHRHESDLIKYMYYAIPYDIYNDWQKLIPEKCGILGYKRGSGGHVMIWKLRRAQKQSCRKLTGKEQLKLAKLGCMRIWSLKKKINDR